MARKNLLAGLAGLQLPAGNSPIGTTSEVDSPPSIAPHFGVGGTRGAIGAVTRSIEQLKAHAIVEIAADLIDPSFITDRLDGSPESHQELLASIRDHGQQVPVLVRPHPKTDGRYQIAYGRRRVRALAELGRSVRAVVKPLTDDQLVVAQGQENSARTDLSFIERALFAARLEEGGFGRETIMAALSVDKTGLSRLISSAVKIPREIIEAIGSAPKTGRDRWVELSLRLEGATALGKARGAILAEAFATKSSDERFSQLFDLVAPRRQKAPRSQVWKAEDGRRLAHIKDDAKSLTVVIDKKNASDFGAYLVEALPELYAAFRRRSEV